MPEREIIPPMIARIDALQNTVRDLLMYSKPLAPKLQRVDIRNVVVDAAASARASIQAANIEIEPGSAIVYADPEMVRAALLTLLLNACEADGTGPVVVRQREDDARVEVVVSDRGPRLSADTTKPAGTGLGLPIARRLTGRRVAS
jgi:signal transduction histidine kinase